MHEIYLCNNMLPTICDCDILAASEPFYHADRITDFNVLIYVTEGIIYVTEDNTDYSVGKGELLFLKSGIHHYGKHKIARGTKWIYIHFKADDNATLPVFTPDCSLISHNDSVNYRVMLPKSLSRLCDSEFEYKLNQYIDYYRSEDPYKLWHLNMRLYELLVGLADTFAHNIKPSLSDQICAYLNEHLHEPFNADIISQKFYLSYKRIAAIFKKEKNITMQQYHTSVRMNEAKRLLHSTLLSIGEIAAQLGFADALYFSKCFHKSTGYSPSEFRTIQSIY